MHWVLQPSVYVSELTIPIFRIAIDTPTKIAPGDKPVLWSSMHTVRHERRIAATRNCAS